MVWWFMFSVYIFTSSVCVTVVNQGPKATLSFYVVSEFVQKITLDWVTLAVSENFQDLCMLRDSASHLTILNISVWKPEFENFPFPFQVNSRAAIIEGDTK